MPKQYIELPCWVTNDGELCVCCGTQIRFPVIHARLAGSVVHPDLEPPANVSQATQSWRGV